MTIIEALKTGRPFKRPYMNWWVFKGCKNMMSAFDSGRAIGFYEESILADDWEVMPLEEWNEFKNSEAERWLQEVLGEETA